MSESETHRQRGNNLYRTATDNFCAAVQEERVKKALLSYQMAFKTAQTVEETAFACKNIGVASWKLSKLVRNTNGLVNLYHKETMKNFSAAWHNGSFDAKWQTNLEATWLRFVDELLDWITNEFPLWLWNGSALMTDLLSLAHNDVVKSKIFLFIAEGYCDAGMAHLQGDEFKECLQFLHECHFPIEQILKIGTEADKSDAKVIKADVLMTMSVAESAQLVAKGDQFLQMVDTTSENGIDFRYFWDAIDCYRSAIIATRELSIEREAIANSKLAQAYHEMLKDKWRAKDSATLAIQLSQLLAPRNFLMNDWYKEAARIVQFYQQEELAAENLQWENRRKPILEELKVQLEEINSAELKTFGRVDIRKFLKRVYSKFPPKHKENPTLIEDPTQLEYAELKKLLKRAMIDYHPDRINEDQHGIQHKVLCEEIYKVICHEYNCM